MIATEESFSVITMDFSTSLKQLRTEKNLTQKELADRSGVSDTIISRLENGHIQDPRFSTVARLARGLDMTPSELVREVDRGDSETEHVLQFLKEHKDVLGSRFHVEEIGVFGSVARGQDTRSSDVDILVKYRSGHRDIFNHSNLEEYLESNLERSVDLVMDSREARETHPRIHKNIREDLIRV